MKGSLAEKFTSAITAIGQQALTAGKAATKAVTQEVLGAQCLLDYSVGQQVASGGPGGLWKVYAARSKKEGSPNPLVSAWVLDKKDLLHRDDQLSWGGSSGGGGGGGLSRPSQRRLESFVEQCRHGVHALARLKHPAVLRLVAPLEETRTQLVFITEPVFASLADLLGAAASDLPPQLAQERRQLKLSGLEIKHGLLQVADGLHFLHSEAGLAHKNICPSSIIITQSGAWKLAGFGFSSPLDFSAPNQKAYDYSDPDPPLLLQVSQPPLPYVAPELVASGTTAITGAADIFSLAATAFELLARRQLLPVGHSLADYESRVHSLTLVDMSGIPSGLEQPLRQMLSSVAAARPPAAALAGCQYFQGDVLLRALKFLDSMIQRDTLQKAAFLRDLPAMCAQFDTRVLRYKVLPPLLLQLRDEQLQPTLLPIVLKIVQTQDPSEFADSTLPALKPLLASASGETLLLLVQNAELLAKSMPAPVAAQVLPALLARAAQHGDVRAQEEMLKKVSALADSLDYEGLKKVVLPAVHALCLGTTSAAVRVSAFAAMSRLVGRMDQSEAETMLQTAVKVCAVDKSAPTAMCVLALGGALGKQWGPRLAAERVLPTLAPLLVLPALSSQQFSTALKTVREVLGYIEKSRAADGGGMGPAAAASSGAAAMGTLGAPGAGGRPGSGTAAAAGPAPSDWLAATAVGPVGSSNASSSSSSSAAFGGGPARTSAQAAPLTPAAAANGHDWLAGLQLQPAAAAARLAAAAPSSSGSPGGGAAFGLSGRQVGSGKPVGAALPAAAFGGTGPGGMAPMRPAQPAASSMGGMGGINAGGSGSFLPAVGFGGGSPGASSIADPFAGLQLGGGGSSSTQWPAPAPPQPSSAVFDPFALGSIALGGSAASGQQLPAARAQQQQQQQQRPGAGGFGVDSLI